MTIDAVSDIFAFACSEAQWWDLAVPSDEEGDAPEVVEGVDRDALEAARRHVADSVEALLLACLAEFKRRAPQGDSRYDALRRKNPQSAATRRNHDVWAEIGRGPKRGWLHASLESDWDGKTIRLYASVSSAVTNIDEMEAAFPPPDPSRGRVGRHYYAGEVPVELGASFASMAKQLADQAWPTVLAYVGRMSPQPDNA